MRRLAGVLAATAFACAIAGRERDREVLNGEPAAAHAVHSERLAEAMRGLAVLAEDRLPQSMDLRAAKGRRREELVAVALAMAESAAAIRETSGDTSLDASERATFVRLANRLRDDALALAGAANEQRLTELTARAEAVRQTCSECHRSFGIPGTPDAP